MSIKRTVYNINGNGGAFVAILASQAVRRIRIMEVPDPANPANAYAPQGLRYTVPTDNFTQMHRTVPGETVERGEEVPFEKGRGPIIGMPAQSTGDGTAVAATTLIKLLSDSAAATVVEVEEYS